MKYIAHSENSHGERQTMRQHSEGVARMMKSFALSDEYVDMYTYCGLLHDVGKYSKGFQKYIRAEGEKEPHAKWGAYMAKMNKLINIAFPVFGHHAGLPNRDDMFETFNLCEKEESKLLDVLYSLKDDGLCIPPCNNSSFNRIKGNTPKELFVRMLYSSLVDADSLDTERHFDKEQYDARPQLSLDVDALLDALNYKLSSFSLDSPINKLRTEVRLYAQSLAAQPQGCFSMTLPTGMGKTLCSLNWALHHAKAHSNIKRIVIVLPFLSIIDQTAKELKSIFKDHDVILEHHSNVICEGKESEEGYYCKNPKQLATENWDYPIVVTTAVQFFESLFSNQRSKCRKLHNLQDSIVIFDEIQTLPVKLAECTMNMLNDMLHLCRCSLLFCTATQPNFQTRSDFKGIDRIVPLVENPTAIFAATKRVEYYPIADYEAQSINIIAKKVCEQNDSVLIVCNTKKKTKALFDILKEISKIPIIHLSTNMVPTHRMKTIEGVRNKLKKGEKLILCSTQLIEAGVDMDFPVVFRELAPLESIIQSAGRCNREGKLDKGKVFLFQLEEEGQPSAEYKTFAQFAQSCYHNNENRLTDADFYAEYYTDIVKHYAPKKDTITPKREKLMFHDVADKYHIIDSSATSLFVYRYNEKSLNLYKEIIGKEYLSRKDYQQIAQYSVQVHSKFERDNADRIAETSNGIKIWSGAYSEEFGLSSEYEIYCI